MKRMLFILFPLLFLISVYALAEETPFLHLKKGINEFSLSVLNSWNMNLNDVRIMVDREKVPAWLKIHEGDQKIDIIKGEPGEEKFILVFDVSDTPLNAFAEIPYTLKDNRGNIWNFTVKVTSGLSDESAPEAFDALYENFPNPFNPTTIIKYSLKENKHTKLVIYNSLGQVIRTLVNEKQDVGSHNVQWDGKSDNGQQVSSGLYFYCLKSGSFVKTRRMMLIE